MTDAAVRARSARRPLRRRYQVHLTAGEAAALRELPSDRVGLDFLEGTPRLKRRGDDRWTVTAFVRWGMTDGFTGARADVRLVGGAGAGDEAGGARVRLRSGGLVLGWSCTVLATLFLLSPLLLLLPGGDEWIVQPLAGPLGGVVFGVLGWLLLARRFRQPRLDALEADVRRRIGGRWEPVSR